MSRESTPNDTPESGAPDAAAPKLVSAREHQRKCEAGALAVLHANGAAPERKSKAGKPESFSGDGATWECSDAGVFWQKGDLPKTKVCACLRIEAKTRGKQNEGWGLRLYWRDDDGREHRQTLPMELLHGDSTEVVRLLAAGGLNIANGRLLRSYLLAGSPAVKERVRYVAQAGWHGDSYVTPEETFAAAVSERVMLEDASGLSTSYGRKGDAQSWLRHVAALAIGNTRLVFAICCAFAGPMLARAGMESGGFHFVGSSSGGKTTALRLAVSPWGDWEPYHCTWRATANGLEAIAARYNDGLLVLDEMGQCDPKEAAAAAYMLANGKGKARASRTGGAREAASWRLLVLSSGEPTLAAHMESAGKRVNAGQEVRLVNIPADAGAGMFMLEDLHGFQKASDFANALKAACDAHHGAAAPEFLRKLLEDFAETGSDASEFVRAIDDFVRTVVPAGASGQVVRVARRFGQVAASGKLATDYGITGWGPDEAERAAAACFRAWLEGFGTGSHEDRAAVEQVVTFLEKHGSSRFENKDGKGQPVRDRAGFWEEESGIRLYHVLPGAFREMVAGFEPKRAAQAVLSAGLLRRGDKLQRQERLPGLGKVRVYTIALAGEEQA